MNFNNNDINNPSNFGNNPFNFGDNQFNFGDDSFSNLPPFIDGQGQNNDGYMSYGNNQFSNLPFIDGQGQNNYDMNYMIPNIGFLEGYHEVTFEDGAVFKGEWRRGEPTSGRIEYPDGKWFEGTLKNHPLCLKYVTIRDINDGKEPDIKIVPITGKGKLSIGGNSCEGEWKEGVFQSKMPQWVQCCPHEGKWENGVFQSIDGQKQNNDGHMSHMIPPDVLEGYHEVTFEDGAVFKGEWRRGEPTSGRIEYPDGKWFEGTLKKDPLCFKRVTIGDTNDDKKPDIKIVPITGEGNLSIGGISYEGKWENGVYKSGKITTQDGSIFNGETKVNENGELEAHNGKMYRQKNNQTTFFEEGVEKKKERVLFDGNVTVTNIAPDNRNNSPVYKTMGKYGLMPASAKNDGKRSQKDIKDNKMANRITFSNGNATGKLVLMDSEFYHEFCKITIGDYYRDIKQVESGIDEDGNQFLEENTAECLRQKVGDDVFYNLILNKINPAKRKKKGETKKNDEAKNNKDMLNKKRKGPHDDGKGGQGGGIAF